MAKRSLPQPDFMTTLADLQKLCRKACLRTVSHFTIVLLWRRSAATTLHSAEACPALSLPLSRMLLRSVNAGLL